MKKNNIALYLPAFIEAVIAQIEESENNGQHFILSGYTVNDIKVAVPFWLAQEKTNWVKIIVLSLMAWIISGDADEFEEKSTQEGRKNNVYPGGSEGVD